MLELQVDEQCSSCRFMRYGMPNWQVEGRDLLKPRPFLHAKCSKDTEPFSKLPCLFTVVIALQAGEFADSRRPAEKNLGGKDCSNLTYASLVCHA